MLSERTGEAHEFIMFTSDPATPALMSRRIGVASLVDKSITDLTDDELNAVSGTPSIEPGYEAYLDEETFIKETREKMLAST